MDNQPNADVPEPGSPDPNFGDNGIVIPSKESGVTHAIVSDESGRLTHASRIGKEFLLARLLMDGDVDEGFVPTTSQFETGDQSIPMRLLLQKDGKIVLIGESKKDNVRRPGVRRFHPNGSPDLIFGNRIRTGPDNSFAPVVPHKFVDGCLQDDQKILIVANYYVNYSLGTPVSRLYRLQSNGEPDTGFGNGQGFIDIKFKQRDSFARMVHVQRDGKIIVTGLYFDAQKERCGAGARYSVEGNLDTTFGTDGFSDISLKLAESPKSTIASDFLFSDSLSCLQSDDKVIFATWTRGADGRDWGLLTRLNADGSNDQQFNAGSPALTSRKDADVRWRAAAVQADGKIVVVGYVRWETPGNELFMAKQRFSPEGQPEDFAWFNSPGDYWDVAIQSSKRIVVSGSSGGSSTGEPRVIGLLAE
ncbi:MULTISPECIES: delta-60 repeat domain-containing protein [Pseudomonas]|uniref:Delta-60 repeat domain-containing protein n=1 Tax=Pseudomonas wuhanensis TaxID=2954098 RepID=A0ABY9GU16_9PSED|nr:MULTISPECIES: delta-60 repeat domain-containing protein [unclassified Pseudomonas]WLI13115.1 delta-60 repeat domain-containing protein [Pseudomonas sp. FP603]WLI18997.1 delta-60 repeat domain-containing protein [Pseudomonas sp. FP607]